MDDDSSDPRTEAFAEAARCAVARHDPRPTTFRRLWARGVAAFSRLVMLRLNSVSLIRPERLREAQAPGRGLLTFSNHVSLFDDPLLTACLTGPDWDTMRWIGADALNFFGSGLRAFFANGGKCIPVIRGAGLDQPGMEFMAARLAAGDWVHLFPEGGRTRCPDGLLRRPLKPGMAWLIRASRPMLLPWYHLGMQNILPIGALVPRSGHEVSVTLGEVVDSASGLADRSMSEITDWAEGELLRLEQEARGRPDR